MTVPTEVTELAALKDALNSNEQVAGNIEKAARVVAAFTDQQAVSALDTVLATVDGSDQAGAAVESHGAADQAVQHADILLAEVTRFLSLPREALNKGQNSTSS